MKPDRLAIAHPGQRPHPRRFARVASAPRILEWWRRECVRLGREATGDHFRCWWRIFEYLSVNPQLMIEDCELVVTTGERWPRAQKRTRRERSACRLGAVNKPERGERLTFWIVPKDISDWEVLPPPKGE